MWLDAAGFKGHIAAVTEEEVEPADTDHEKEHQEPRARWGVIASVLVHVPLVALLIFGLPKIQPKPAEDESVKVELVPPPEEKKPEEKKAEEKPKEEEKPQEHAKAEPPPPPPPPTAEKAPEQAKPMPMPALQTIAEYGDKDTGPQKSMTGNSSQGEVKPAETAPPHDAQANQSPAEAAAEKPQTETPPAKPVPEDVKLPETAAADVSHERNAPLAELSGEAKTSIEQTKPAEPKLSEIAKAEPMKDELTEAKTLFSQNDDDDPVARTAMEGVPRGMRAGKLCASELQQQLIHASPSVRPMLVPTYDLSNGTVLDVRAGAFRTIKGWYNVRFRCAVDENATKVVSFALDVGDAIPRSQWKSRGLGD